HGRSVLRRYPSEHDAGSHVQGGHGAQARSAAQGGAAQVGAALRQCLREVLERNGRQDPEPAGPVAVGSASGACRRSGTTSIATTATVTGWLARRTAPAHPV